MFRVLNLLIVWLLLATPAWSLTTLYVDTDAVSPSPPTYSSLADAVAALPSTLDDAYVIECSGSAADTITTTLELTAETSESNTLTLRGDYTGGPYSANQYELQMSANANMINVGVPYVTIESMQFVRPSDTAAEYRYSIASTGVAGANYYLSIARSLFLHLRDGYSSAISLNSYDDTASIINNIIIGGYHGVSVVDSDDIRIANNVFSDGGGTGIKYSPDTDSGLIANNIVTGYQTDYSGSVTAPGSASNNISSDATAPGANSLTSQLATDIFTDPANGDYTLKPGSPAIGAGADLSAYFTADITGATRTVPWDIGAYKYATAVATPWRYYNGSAWIDATAYRYDGSAWQPITTKHYTGSAWE